jgi:PilZ domain
VTDIASTARTARESLARGLTALQSDPNIPAPLLDLAGTIAQSMGSLHQIERSNGTQLVPHAQNALNNVRAALSQLQAQPATHPAVAQAMEAVAGALGMVHALNKLAGDAPVAAPPQAAPPQQQQPAWAAPTQAAPPQQAWAPPPQAQPPAVAYGPPPQQQQYGAPAQQPQYGAPQAARAPVADPFAAPRGQSPMAATAVAPSGGPAPFQPNSARPPSPPAAGDLPVVTADLGAHSPTNFYKGLSGNDVIDHGGLFVSTYMIPAIGAPVRLRVSLPGGYEFEANAVVKWSREQGGDAPPGFGAQFTAITPEARQLVYRYVRNREPLFHDDL